MRANWFKRTCRLAGVSSDSQVRQRARQTDVWVAADDQGLAGRSLPPDTTKARIAAAPSPPVITVLLPSARDRQHLSVLLFGDQRAGCQERALLHGRRDLNWYRLLVPLAAPQPGQPLANLACQPVPEWQDRSSSLDLPRDLHLFLSSPLVPGPCGARQLGHQSARPWLTQQALRLEQRCWSARSYPKR